MTSPDIINKQIIALQEAKILGTVDGFLADKRCRYIKYLSINEQGFVYLIPFSALRGTKDVVTVISAEKLCPAPCVAAERFAVFPLNAGIYTPQGERRGTVTDLEFDRKGKIIHILCGNENIQPDKVNILDDIFILKCNSVKVRPKRHGVPKKAKDDTASITPAAGGSFNWNFPSPEKASDFMFLKGKICTTTLWSADGKAIITKGNIVDLDELVAAENSGCLKELAIFTR